MFLGANGWELNAAPVDAIGAVVALAGSEIGEEEFAAWLSFHVKRL